MTYHKATRDIVRVAPKTLGTQLARLALRKNVSVAAVAARLGSTRATVYSWYAGRQVSNAYKAAVRSLIKELQQ